MMTHGSGNGISCGGLRHVFSGTGILCGNHNSQALTRLAHMDYICVLHLGRPGEPATFLCTISVEAVA